MHANQKPRRRHSEEFKAQVMAACGEPGASVSAVALSFGLNTNLVRQWQRGRGYKPNQAAASQAGSQAQPQFVALSLPAPCEPAAPRVDSPAQAIRVELKRGALAVNVSWPVAASSQCTAWLRELLR
jgi:transposase